jgi:GTPase involved in cell partitioning and DNA repair
MDSPTPCLESPAAPSLKQLRNMLGYDTDDLMDQVEDFSTMVQELKDYSWRLTKKETAFLEVALELQKKLVFDAAFIQTAENVEYCHKEVEEALAKKIDVTKERIDV